MEHVELRYANAAWSIYIYTGVTSALLSSLSSLSISISLSLHKMSTNLSPSTAVNDQRIVQRVRVVAHTLGPAGPNTSDNHWSIYLLLIGNASIRVNMAAEPGFIDGELRLTSQTYQLTNSAIAHFDFDTLGSPRVADFLRIIYQNRRHIYEMSGGGSGCRYWM